MKIIPTGRGISFDQVERGATFRFSHEGKSPIALKMFLGKTDAALVLTDGSMTVLRGQDLESNVVLGLVDVALMPSVDERAVVLRRGYVAEPGELELNDGRVLLVFPTPAGYRRADVATGEVLTSSGSQPVIVTEWSLVQTVLGKPTAIFTRKAPVAAAVRA